MSQQLLIDSRRDYENGYYENKLQEGLEFQDVVTRELYKCGIVIVGYSSKKYQHGEGENIIGAEIKRDGKFRETGNLYIEIDEKSHPDKLYYTASGIHRADNSWLFIIGDETTIYIFSTKMLRLIESRYKHVEKPTSHGFLLPVTDADKFCAKKIYIEEVPF